MNAHQRAAIAEAPPSCQGILERAFAGNSRTTAIKAFCLQCVGFIRADVKNCTAYKCALHPYRPYQTDDEISEDAAAGIATEGAGNPDEAPAK